METSKIVDALQAEMDALKKQIAQFMKIHNNPHDTCKHDDMAKKLDLIAKVLRGEKVDLPTTGTTDGTTDQPNTGGDLGALKEAVEQARAKAKEALGTVEDLNAKQIKIADAEKAKVTAYVAKVDEFLKAYEGADDAQKKAFDAANSGYVAEIKQSRDWNANNFLPRTEGGGSDTGNGNEDPNQGSELPENPSIGSAVGTGAKNHPPNVKIIQMLLNKKGAKLTVDGKISDSTIAAIERFQANVFDGEFDGVIQPNDKTFKKLVGTGGSAAGSGRPTPKPGSNTGNSGDLPAALGATSKISGSVGQGGKNNPQDVLTVRKILNEFKFNLEESQQSDSKLVEAIKKFQKDYVGSSRPDGRVDANGGTWKTMLGLGRLQGGIDKIASKYGVEPAVIMAIQSVEAGGNGFLSDGRPLILFEGHIFWSELKKVGKNPSQYQRSHPSIVYPRWTKAHYKGGAAEYGRLEQAIKIHRTAALKSASWGEFQIMGFNHQVVGYSDVESFVESMKKPGSNQVSAVMEFVKNNNLLRHVQGSSKNWAGFARGYNGPGYAQNQYDKKLAAAYARFSRIG